MLPSGGILEKARKARDARFDGRFFIAVRTTGIYCRPVCPVRMPRAENVTFFESAAAASEAGYRPCLRCRPESSPGTPAWRGTSTTVARALRLINEGALDNHDVVTLSDRLGVTTRHLSRLFTEHLGASPKTVALTRRLQFAKQLIDETAMPMTDVALSAGYGSVRRFNDHIVGVYGVSPTQLRKHHRPSHEDGVILKCTYREPYDAEALFAFFSVRATPGVEVVTDTTLSRTFSSDGVDGRLSISIEPRQLICRISGGSARSLMGIVSRVRRMFDLDAIPEEINAALASDLTMNELARRHPGQRLPGSFNAFETGVRAIVGQQVSVKGATTIMGRIAKQYGRMTSYGQLFPSPKELAELDPEKLSMPVSRANAIRSFARQVADENLRFDMEADEFVERIQLIKGIGPWTADYIAMRVLGDPDAFLHGDLVIRKVMQRLYGVDSDKQLLKVAENWRPWRGYAGMHLWRNA